LIVGLFLAAEPRGGTTASDEETRIADRKPA
jgi:hypothetical protein